MMPADRVREIALAAVQGKINVSLDEMYELTNSWFAWSRVQHLLTYAAKDMSEGRYPLAMSAVYSQPGDHALVIYERMALELEKRLTAEAATKDLTTPT